LKLKAGIIGLGRIASTYEDDIKARRFYPYLTHAGMYMKHPRYELICGADKDSMKLKKFRAMWGVQKVYLDYRDMIADNELDVVSVCTHPDIHHEIIKNLINKVKVIFCEKPFTKNSDEIRDIIDLTNSGNTKITVNLYREYDKTHLNIRRMLQLEEFGKTIRFNAFYGKGLRNQGTHLFGYLIGTFGKPEHITVLGKKKYDGMAEYAYDIYLKFKNGITGMVQCFDFNHYRLFEFDFICEKGRICIADEGLKIKLYERADNRAETGAFELRKTSRQIKSSIGYALKYAADHIERLCRVSDIEPVVSPKVYLDVQLTLEEIEKQGESLKCNPA
jgi:predicted dehydrogenase